MRKLIVLVLVAAAAWYGWKHWGDLKQAPRDVAVIENNSGRELVRVRLKTGSETFVRESIPDGQRAEFPFRVSGDGTFTLTWQYDREGYDKTWTGGEFAVGPMRTRHHIQVMGDGGVIWTAEHMAAGQP